MINYLYADGFLKDLKQLSKKFRTLEADLEVAKRQAIENFHINKIDNNGIFKISGFPCEGICFFVVKKFACKALKNKGAHSGIRIIYAFAEKNNTVEFIELYFKSEQTIENMGRIKEYIKYHSGF